METTVFDNVDIFTGQQVSENALMQRPNTTNLLSAEQSRAIAEVQGMMIVAKLNPRDPNKSYLKIMKECQRYSLADQATYIFHRGSSEISGATIRLAEVLARNWENLDYGFKEYRKEGGSEVVAFCHDLETNTRVQRQFFVPFWRDTKEGGHAVDQERDRYELVANMAQRRVRACILEQIPGDVTDAAVKKCKETLSKGGGLPLEDRIRKMLEAFDEIGVTQEQIERRLEHPLDKGTTHEEIGKLIEIYRTLRDGVQPKDVFFKPVVSRSTEEESETKPTKKAAKKDKKKEQPAPPVQPQDSNPFAEKEDFIRRHGVEDDVIAIDAIYKTEDPEGGLDEIIAKIKARPGNEQLSFGG